MRRWPLRVTQSTTYENILLESVTAAWTGSSLFIWNWNKLVFNQVELGNISDQQERGERERRKEDRKEFCPIRRLRSLKGVMRGNTFRILFTQEDKCRWLLISTQVPPPPSPNLGTGAQATVRQTNAASRHRDNPISESLNSSPISFLDVSSWHANEWLVPLTEHALSDWAPSCPPHWATCPASFWYLLSLVY